MFFGFSLACRITKRPNFVSRDCETIRFARSSSREKRFAENSVLKILTASQEFVRETKKKKKKKKKRRKATWSSPRSAASALADGGNRRRATKKSAGDVVRDWWTIVSRRIVADPKRIGSPFFRFAWQRPRKSAPRTSRDNRSVAIRGRLSSSCGGDASRFSLLLPMWCRDRTE